MSAHLHIPVDAAIRARAGWGKAWTTDSGTEYPGLGTVVHVDLGDDSMLLLQAQAERLHAVLSAALTEIAGGAS